MNHEIKTEYESFEAQWSGLKTFSIRLNDRHYQKGDSITQWEVKNGYYTGRWLKGDVLFITNWMQKENIVVMSLVFTKKEKASYVAGRPQSNQTTLDLRTES